MISRYSRPEMVKIWETNNKFKIWLEIELLAMEAWAELGKIPKEVAKICRQKAKFDLNAVEEKEKEVKHDVIAFLTVVEQSVGPEARFMHKGMTSSDVLDTCYSVQLQQASDLLLADLKALLVILRKKAEEHKMTLMIGRSHGIHAEPITFGLKVASWYAEMKRQLVRIELAREEISVGKISGAVGTFAHVQPEIEATVCQKLGLRPDSVSTQVISRDRYAVFFSRLALVASSVERIATEIRHLQRTEVLEVEEFFSTGQKGSSAMPHKRNPVLSENLCGLARLVRSMALPALENMALWHERDISHSSVERIIGPEATILMDFMLVRLARLVEQLVVYPENMKKNLDKLGGLHNSQRVLLALTEKGCTREDAYDLVQRNAMKVWEEGKDFLSELKNDTDVAKYLSVVELTGMFDLAYHTKHVDTIFKRVFGA